MALYLAYEELTLKNLQQLSVSSQVSSLYLAYEELTPSQQFHSAQYNIQYLVVPCLRGIDTSKVLQ